MPDQKKQDKVLTEQGLALKGVERISRIRGEAIYKEAVLRTWQFGRIIRRDYYLLSYKLVFAMRSAEIRSRVKRAMDDVAEEADVLNCMTMKSELPTPNDSTYLNLRVVNGEAERMLEALLVADRALAKLNVSELAEVADENCTRLYGAYARLKNILLKPAAPREDAMY